MTGHGDAHLYPQHLGGSGRGRWISWVQSQPDFNSKFQESQRYSKTLPQNNNNNNNNNKFCILNNFIYFGVRRSSLEWTAVLPSLWLLLVLFWFKLLNLVYSALVGQKLNSKCSAQIIIPKCKYFIKKYCQEMEQYQLSRKLTLPCPGSNQFHLESSH